MIYKMPHRKDPFKEQIEKDKKELSKLHKESSKEQIEAIKRLEKEVLPKLEEDILKLILNIKKNALSCSPQQILDYFAFVYGISTSDKILEDIDSLNNAYLDYVVSLVTSLDYLNINDDCNDENLDSLKNNIEELHQQVIHYHMITSVDENKSPDKMRFLQSVNNLFVKGDSYPEHKIELCKNLFSKYDDLLIKAYNINALNLIEELVRVANYPLSNFDIQTKYMSEMKNAHEEYKKNYERAKKNNELDTFLEDFKKSEALKQTQENIQKINDETNISFNDSIFKIHKTSLPTEILEQLSISIGENIIFQEGKIDYFPINNSQIYEKPLVKIDDMFYCFNSPNLFYNLQLIIENLILNLIPENKRSKQYANKKGEFLEDKSIEFFQKLLPKSKTYKNLKYNKDDEVDGIIIYDNRVFIIEAKSNKFSLGAKKGSIGSIKSDTKKIIEKAYQQSIRAKEYILSKDSVEFKNHKKEVVLTIDSTKISNIYMINTTLEALGNITSNLNSLDRFGFIKGKDWIWSVYLNDLQIISEIIDSPTEFILYLERRIRLNDYHQIHTMEEIDIFGYFLHNGLYFDDIDFPKDNYMMQVVGFSQELDEYYLWKEGKLKTERKKPSFYNKCKTKEIVKKIEDTNKENSLLVSKILLGYNEQHQYEIKEQVINILQRKRRNFSMILEDENIGFTFIHDKYPSKEDMQFYCKVSAYERKINNWFLIYINGRSLQNLELNFDNYYFDNEHNELLENEVIDLKERRLEQSKAIMKKIGRNDICPCGSGKKYKRCCL